MRLPPDLVSARFVERLNRFAALVEVQGKAVQAHVANSGRLRELFIAGRTVYLARRASVHRRTVYDLQLVELPQGLVSADARLPNALVLEAFLAGRLPQFTGFNKAQREVMDGRSRIDLALAGPQGRCLVEVKSVTLVEDGFGIFPDAPTERGRRHVLSLMGAKRRGDRAAILFVIQRGDALAFRPHAAADPEFGRALRRAAKAGVELYAYRCRVSRTEVAITDRVPTDLGKPGYSTH